MVKNTGSAFLHATGLHTMIVDNRRKRTFDFGLLLLRSANVNKKVVYIVPERFKRKFKKKMA